MYLQSSTTFSPFNVSTNHRVTSAPHPSICPPPLPTASLFLYALPRSSRRAPNFPPLLHTTHIFYFRTPFYPPCQNSRIAILAHCAFNCPATIPSSQYFSLSNPSFIPYIIEQNVDLSTLTQSPEMSYSFFSTPSPRYFSINRTPPALVHIPHPYRPPIPHSSHCVPKFCPPSRWVSVDYPPQFLP